MQSVAVEYSGFPIGIHALITKACVEFLRWTEALFLSTAMPQKTVKLGG